MEKQAYDLEKVYDEQISPLMGKIIEICREHNMPFLADFQYAFDGEDHAHCMSTWLPEDRDVDESLTTSMDLIKPKRSRPLNLTVRDKDGNTTKMITILG